MLYQLGPVSVDVWPFNADSVQGEAAADFANKALIGRRPGYEFMGEGEETWTLSGQLLPTKLGGLDELEMLHDMRRNGDRIMVARGDGKILGWYAVQSISEGHEKLGPDGVGQVIKHSIKLLRVDEPGADEGAGLLSKILSLF